MKSWAKILSLLVVSVAMASTVKADREMLGGYPPQLRYLNLNRMHVPARFNSLFDPMTVQVARRSIPDALGGYEEDPKVVIRKSGNQDRSKSLMMRLFKRNGGGNFAGFYDDALE